MQSVATTRRHPARPRVVLDGATGLDTAVGLVDKGHPGSLVVGDRPDPADRHTRAA